MRLAHDDTQRVRLTAALRPAREEAYGAGEFVGQESFMTAGEILALARATGVTAGALALDLCCGAGGPALYLARETGCRIVGLDHSPPAIRLARCRAGRQALARRVAFVVADANRPPLAAHFDAALLLETFLSIEDKAGLLGEVARLLPPGARFGLTLETGRPLSREERRRLPGGEQTWLLDEGGFLALLERAGFQVRQAEDHTAAHADLARCLLAAFLRHGDAIAAGVGAVLRDEIIAAHRVWVDWLTRRRVRKLAFVLERA